MTRKPTKVKTFMPNRMSLVNTILLPLPGLNFIRRQRFLGIFPGLANLGYALGRPRIFAPAVNEEFHATVRSATSTLPFVSGLNSTATRKMAKPTTVVTRIGPDRPIW